MEDDNCHSWDSTIWIAFDWLSYDYSYFRMTVLPFWFLIITNCAEKEKVEGEELKEWLKLVVAPAELSFFIRGKNTNLQLEAGS